MARKGPIVHIRKKCAQLFKYTYLPCKITYCNFKINIINKINSREYFSTLITVCVLINIAL